MCNKAVVKYEETLNFVHGSYKNQNICNQAVDIIQMHYNMFPNALKLKKCVIKLLILIFLQ